MLDSLYISTRSPISKSIIKTTPTKPLEPEALAKRCVAVLEEGKAEDIQLIDVRGKSDFSDYMVVASGTSSRHVGALAGHVEQALKAIGFESVPAEGLEAAEWVLVDAGSVIVHLFKPEARERYRLEKMWSI